jgi:hypothetical protein
MEKKVGYQVTILKHMLHLAPRLLHPPHLLEDLLPPFLPFLPRHLLPTLPFQHGKPNWKPVSSRLLRQHLFLLLAALLLHQDLSLLCPPNLAL